MPRDKSQTIFAWKKNGLIYDDYNELYEVYIKTMNCQHCEKEFKNSRDRCMDHDHDTGLFRKIVCQSCNVMDSYIKYPNGYDFKLYYQNNLERYHRKQQKYRDNHKEELKERNKVYYQQNKESLLKSRSQWEKEKTTCICGDIVSKGWKSKHQKSQRHLKNMDKYMENVD